MKKTVTDIEEILNLFKQNFMKLMEDLFQMTI